MSNITWINLLHFYQPPTASDETVIEAIEKSYKKTINILKNNPKIKFTVNLTGCLLERFEKLGYHDLLAGLKSLYDNNQIEFTGTAAYHPILPLLPREEIKRNIEANQAILKKYFGKNFKASGFFPPELAFSEPMAEIIKSLGYDWIVLDEIAAEGKLNKLDFKKSYRSAASGLKIFFRSRQFSKSYVPETLLNLLNKNYQGVICTATDAELYGLRHIDFNAVFEKLIKTPELATLTISEFLADSAEKEKVDLRLLNSSWESTPAELKRGQPYILWQNKKNRIHKLLWQLAYLAITAVNANPNDANHYWARLHLDQGLSSCTFWWASGRDFKLFSSLSWSPDEIERGINELIRSIRSLANPKTKEEKIAGEKLYIKIKQLIWHKHWNYYWLKNTN